MSDLAYDSPDLYDTPFTYDGPDGDDLTGHGLFGPAILPLIPDLFGD